MSASLAQRLRCAAAHGLAPGMRTYASAPDRQTKYVLIDSQESFFLRRRRVRTGAQTAAVEAGAGRDGPLVLHQRPQVYQEYAL